MENRTNVNPPAVIPRAPALPLALRTGLPFRAAIASTLLCLSMLAGGNPAGAAEIRLLSAAVMQTVFKDIAADFERASGHKLVIDYATMGAINQRVLGGETADLIIGSTPSIVGLVKAGRINAYSQVTIAKVGVGIVASAGDPQSHIESAGDLKRALLTAKIIVYADPAGGGAAGIHVARVIAKLGIAEQLKPKIKLGAGGDVTEVTLAQGNGALGLTQISEIVGKPGARFVGPLPEELQNYTGIAAGTPAGVKPSEGVAAFINFLKNPASAAAMNARGMSCEDFAYRAF